MTIELNTDEVADIINAVEGEMECSRQSLKSLTELEDRYEYNDTQLYISKLNKLVTKLKQVSIGG